MPTIQELARLGKPALLAFVASLLADLAALKTQVADLLAQVARLQAENQALRRASKRQAAPFSKGTRKPNPKRPGRKPGQGRMALPLAATSGAV